MRVEETFADRVGVLVGIGVSVMSSVVSRPPTNGTLDGTATDGSEKDLERKTSRVRGVSPETMVTCNELARNSQNFHAQENHIPAVIPRPVAK
jgi:hypothetical protein